MKKRRDKKREGEREEGGVTRVRRVRRGREEERVGRGRRGSDRACNGNSPVSHQSPILHSSSCKILQKKAKGTFINTYHVHVHLLEWQ